VGKGIRMTVFQRMCSGLPSLALRYLCCSGFLLLSALPSLCQAQITLDGSLGPRGALNGPHYTISDSMGQIRGPNLFHSLGQFNLSRGESATFTGPNTISHILSRVTGGSPSSIDGTIQAQIPGAHLYLLNPSGVMFGPNANVDVSGSFHVSTADYLRLADGAHFSARLSETSVLSVAPPAAFGFLGPAPAAIAIRGSALHVPEGETLSVIGGDIEIMGNVSPTPSGLAFDHPTLAAPGGRIHLASVASAGEVGLNPSAQLQRSRGPHSSALEALRSAMPSST
jgi:filamentous hemagglutinin family protein